MELLRLRNVDLNTFLGVEEHSVQSSHNLFDRCLEDTLGLGCQRPKISSNTKGCILDEVCVLIQMITLICMIVQSPPRFSTIYRWTQSSACMHGDSIMIRWVLLVTRIKKLIVIGSPVHSYRFMTLTCVIHILPRPFRYQIFLHSFASRPKNTMGKRWAEQWLDW